MKTPPVPQWKCWLKIGFIFKVFSFTPYVCKSKPSNESGDHLNAIFLPHSKVFKIFIFHLRMNVETPPVTLHSKTFREYLKSGSYNESRNSSCYVANWSGPRMKVHTTTLWVLQQHFCDVYLVISRASRKQGQLHRHLLIWVPRQYYPTAPSLCTIYCLRKRSPSPC